LKKKRITIDDDGLFFRGVIIVIFVGVVESSPFQRAAMRELLASSGDAIPVATLSCDEACSAPLFFQRGAAFGFGLK
jgi:hypothetical protein